MGQLIEIAAFFYKYIMKVLPEARRLNYTINEKTKSCSVMHIDKDRIDSDSKHIFNTDRLCCFLFSMLPHIELEGFLSFILSLHAIDDVLEEYRDRKDIRDEKEIRSLLNCLSCAVDPSRTSVCSIMDSIKNSPHFTDRSSHDTTGTDHLKCHADKCRLHLAILPSFKQASGKIKKYMQLYIDLQSYRHYPAVISKDLLKTWSSNYLNRYQGISSWEFCAAADTFLGIAAMYAAASVPGITADEIRLLDEACFPWLCGLGSMLDSLINERFSIGMDGLNFSSFYSNLRECEDRIIFLAEKAEVACLKLKDSRLYIYLINMIKGLYLTDPEAGFGMLRLTASNISKRSSIRIYGITCTLMRSLHLL